MAILTAQNPHPTASASDSTVQTILEYLRGSLPSADAASQAGMSEDDFQVQVSTFIKAGGQSLQRGQRGDTTEELMALSAVNQMLGAILVLDDLLKEAVDVLHALFGYFPCIGLIEGHALVIKYGYQEDGSLIEAGTRLPLDGPNPMAWCARNGRLLNVADVQVFHERFDYAPLTGEIASFLSFPLILKGNVLGVLLVSNGNTHAFTSRDVNILETVAFHLAVAVENALLFNQIERRVNQLELFRKIAVQAIEARDVSSVIEFSARVTHELFTKVVIGIGIFDEGKDSLDLIVIHPDHNQHIPTRFILKVTMDTLVGEVIRTGTFRAFDTATEAHQAGLHFYNEDSQSAVYVPIRLQNRLIGIVMAEGQAPYTFDQPDITTLKLLADQLAIAIRGATLFEQTQTQLDEIRLFRRLADESNVAIITRDRDGVIDYANQAAAEIFDCESAEALYGVPLHQFTSNPASWREEDRQIIAWAVQLGGWSGEIKLRPRRGWEIIAEVSLFPVYNSEGDFVTFGMILQDVTERRALVNAMEQEKVRFEAVFEATDEGMIVWDEKWRIVLVNRTAANYLGVPGDLLEEFSRATARLLPPLEKLMNAPEGSRVELEGKTRRVVTCRHIPWHTATGAGYLTIIYDETSRVELEKARENTLHMLVHDLRSPLQSVMGGVVLAQSTLEESPDAATALRHLGKAERGLTQVMNVAENFLQITKLEAGVMSLRPTLLHPRALLDEVVGTITHKAAAKGIVPTVAVSDDAPSIYADIDLTRRALINFYDNAIKFSPEGGSIELCAGQGAEGGLLFSVADSGPGVPEGYRQMIFEKYGQAPNQEKGIKGTGLGLALCRLVAEAHRGQVWVDPGMLQGSVFYLLLQDCNPGRLGETSDH